LNGTSFNDLSVAPDPDFKVAVYFQYQICQNNARWLLFNINRKSYTIYQMTSMTLNYPLTRVSKSVLIKYHYFKTLHLSNCR